MNLGHEASQVDSQAVPG